MMTVVVLSATTMFAIMFLWPSALNTGYLSAPPPIVETAARLPGAAFVRWIERQPVSGNAGRYLIRLHNASCVDGVTACPHLLIRIVGPRQLKSLFAARVDDLHWAADYHLECAGLYRVEFLPTFQAYVAADGNITRQLAHFNQLQRLENVIRDAFAVPDSLAACDALHDPSSLPICTRDLVQSGGGSWIIDGAGDAGPDALSAEQIADFLTVTKYHLDEAYDPAIWMRLSPSSWEATGLDRARVAQLFQRLKYRFFSCQAGDLSRFMPADGRICLAGDSHARHLHNSMEIVINPSNIGCLNAAAKEICQATAPLTYIMAPYGEIPEADLAACRVLLFNTGQHPLAVLTTPSDYATMVDAVFGRLSRMANPPKMYWLTTMLLVFCREVMRARDEGRIPARTAEFNRIATAAAQRAGLPIVDLFAVALPVFDLSYDHAHYKSPIGDALVTLALLSIDPGDLGLSPA
ncbi:unnamed protein product (mitochondrion) [Plasmodiophora brassicae]|uniref:SGNH hydrolase-type esterase domain-containing protein n=1 Tax=Plasmodiophora brassicae TaxID=37360 RepID=A0A0G4IJ80_PLABS|nr:hypothetical protein PBRA_004062 [Plasmodiophora brassicae]SPQ96257.1 unnamed protein product [Plasmodiophora brassicae]